MSPPAATVLFDEGHSEAWTIRSDVAEAMQPSHPGDASYAHAAALLRERGFAVATNLAPLDAERLAESDLLIIAHPSDPAWEQTTGCGSPQFTEAELDAVECFVRGGGGLLVLAETEQEKYGSNLPELLARFGIGVQNATVQDYEHSLSAPSWVLAELMDGPRGRGGDPLAGVEAVCLYRAGTLTSGNGASVLARTHGSASIPGASLILTASHGAGRLVVLADSDLFSDDCLEELDHRTLWLNLCAWAARSGAEGASVTAERLPEAWVRLRDETDGLAALQAPDGSLQADPAQARAHVEAMTAAIQELAPAFAHEAEYLDAVAKDIEAWADGGFGKPDFTRSLAHFRPERQRQDGIEHLVVFPMYKQNASRETCFEALVIRVPWPGWVAELERERYDNPKFVPVTLVDATAGYHSECAVLFPETVSVQGRPEANFGAIFCDREAERLRRVAGQAVELLSLNLPPEAARMLDSPATAQEAYILWDLIHDRTHSHGELPFDPFMIRQRSPYWMYSLEELRCDLTTFGHAEELAAEGLSTARHVQYAILLDRLLRFPITGARVRNYDGLGGQLLFAYLHKHGMLSWADNRLTLDWKRVAQGVGGLRDEVEMLYREGIDRSKLAHWCAAHDLISRYVPAAAGSHWVAGRRELPEVEDPRPYVDLVLDDEFPLSIFYVSLKAKLAP